MVIPVSTSLGTVTIPAGTVCTSHEIELGPPLIPRFRISCSLSPPSILSSLLGVGMQLCSAPSAGWNRVAFPTPSRACLLVTTIYSRSSAARERVLACVLVCALCRFAEQGLITPAQHLAIAEMRVILSEIVSSFRFEPIDDSGLPLDIVSPAQIMIRAQDSSRGIYGVPLRVKPVHS